MSLKVGFVFGLCQARGGAGSSAFSPRDRRHPQGQQLQPRHGKKVPEHIACSDGILALNMHWVAKEISNHVQTFMAAPERSWPSYLTVQCCVCDRCVTPLALPGVWAVGIRKALLSSSQHGPVCQMRMQ